MLKNHEIIDLLEKNGKITNEDVNDALFTVIEEALKLNKVEIPKISSRIKRNVVQYFTSIPAKYSRTGKRHQITGSSEKAVRRKFQKEAYEVLEYLVDEERKNTITVEEIVGMYVESLKPQYDGQPGKKKKTTIERYSRIFHNYVKDTQFGSMRMSKVKLYHCEDYIQYLYGRRICYGYVTQIKSVVKMAFSYATGHDMADKNYMMNVVVNPSLCSTERKRKAEVWEEEEVVQICEASIGLWKNRQFRYSALLPILIFTGCRIGELCALKWDDIDFDSGYIRFDKTIIEYTDYVNHKKCREIDAPKTSSSSRRVKLTGYALCWLRELKLRNEEAGIASDQVVVTRKGKIPKQDQLSTSLKRFCKKAGVPYKPSHTGRRTYATEMIDGGIPIRQVSDDLGHKKVSTTLNTYLKAKKESDEMMNKKEQVFTKAYGDIVRFPGVATPGNTPYLETVNEKTP